MLKPLAIAAALSLIVTSVARADPPGWGSLRGEDSKSKAQETGSGHLFTVSVPYSFDKLQSAVSGVQIVCSVTAIITDNNHGQPRGRQSVKKTEAVTPQNGHAAGTAILTWDRTDFDPMADLQRDQDVECWFELEIQGKGVLSYKPNMTGGAMGEGMNGPSPGTLSAEPAAQREHQVPFHPYEFGHLT